MNTSNVKCDSQAELISNAMKLYVVGVYTALCESKETGNWVIVTYDGKDIGLSFGGKQHHPGTLKPDIMAPRLGPKDVVERMLGLELDTDTAMLARCLLDVPQEELGRIVSAAKSRNLESIGVIE